MAKREIFIMTNYGEFRGEADVINGLAVHREFDFVMNEFGTDPSFWWQLTHTKTGCRVGGAWRKKMDAMDLRKKLLELGNWEQWESTAFPTDITKQASAIVNKQRKGRDSSD